MISGLLWLLGCQLAGEALAVGLDLPVPGPVVGMVILFVILTVRRPPESAPVLRAGSALLRHLQLLFIPAGTGIITQFDVVRDHWAPLLGGLVGSWVLGLASVGLVVVGLVRLQEMLRGDKGVRA
ncbi:MULTISPECIES: CidA/LrgA family protein [unclassified Janibacter]|uniref:CidA/LrgA family protein n=1 Tax=unclassified Janibacter TaxID=2649294 RepID=UPI003CFD23F0